MDKIYDYLSEKLRSLGPIHVGSGISAEYMLLAFFPLAFVAMVRGLDNVTVSVLAILVTALVAFSTPLVLKVSRENSDHFNVASFYIAIAMGLIMMIMLGGLY
ncbi:MAG TPA: hypothetical protein PK718_08940 [Candidatus Methanofastidiosa archaeon]|nr:hypothetical protein [Candidatus Methanofastidiosa archaeon]